ncbi:MAG: hypothetical protein FWD73_17655 [Polyangiaceae bacterium]|nr:hypothetical protein [Polyangiaceae bacterium]
MRGLRGGRARDAGSLRESHTIESHDVAGTHQPPRLELLGELRDDVESTGCCRSFERPYENCLDVDRFRFAG